VSITRRQLLILLPAAAVAWKSILAGTPETSPNYNMTDHWWGMLVDITKCIGCGSCVRACQIENQVPDAYFRTWVERYHISDFDIENPKVDSPDGGKNGFPPATVSGGKNFFVPKMCNHCADSPCTQVCPVGATFVSPDGVVLVDQKYCLGCRYCVQACPLRLPLRGSQERDRTEMYAVLSPDHEGAHHRLLRKLSDGRSPTRRPEGSQRSNS